MKRTLAVTLALAGLLSVASPALAATAYPIGTVNIRSGPGTQHAVVGALSEGQRAAVLAREGTWLKVRTDSGTVGYMADWVTREVFDNEVAYLRVDTDVLNVRTRPATDAGVVGQVTEGTQLRLLEGLGGWYKVDAGPAIGTGWVKGEFTYRMTQPPATQPPPTPPPDKPPVEAPRTGLAKQAVVMAAAAMHTGRDTGYDVVAPLKLWERLTYLDSAEGWVKVQNASGKAGWVDGRKLHLEDTGLDWSLQAMYTVRETEWAVEYKRVREVVAGAYDLALRSGPSVDYGVLVRLQPGQRLKLLAVPGGDYVQVLLPDGTAGWVSRTFLKLVPGTPSETVRLRESLPGVLRLEVTGAAAAELTVSDSLLTVPMADLPARAGLLGVGAGGVASLSLDRQGLQVRFDHTFRHRVVERTADRLVVEIRPEVGAIEQVTGADRVTYRFQVTGDLKPAARREAGAVVLSLPGARLMPGVTAPAGLALTATEGGLTARVTTDRTHAIKRGDGYVDLVLFAPGLAGKTVVLDPGHGAFDPGAIGVTGLREKDFNLDLAFRLRTLLEAKGAKVVMTRTADTACASPEDLARVASSERLRYDLNCRTVVPNTLGADLFLSIHANANPSRAARGTETYWSGDNLNALQSKGLATLVQEEMVRVLALPTNRGVLEDMFYVVKYTDAPAALAEVAYLSNTTDEALLKQETVRQQVAEALLRAIDRFFGK